MIRSRSLLALALLVTVSRIPSLADGLRLTTVIDGQVVALSGVDSQSRLLAGPDRSPVGPQAAWTLQGDLRAAAGMVRWAPVYDVRRIEERELALDPEKPWRAQVQVRHLPLNGTTLTKDLAPVLKDWPAGVPDGGVAVVVWLVGSQPTEAIALPLPSTVTTPTFGFAAEFRLTDEQAARGQPVMLLWCADGFVAPQPLFTDTATNDALIALRFDDARTLGAVLPPKARLDSISRDGLALIHYGAEAGATDCVALLAKRDPKQANLLDEFQWTPLLHAADHGRTATASALIAARAKVDVRAPGYDVPITLAIRHGRLDTVETLLATGVRYEQGGGTWNAISRALNHGYTDIAERLHAAKVRYDFKSPLAGNALIHAAVRGHLSTARWLVARGVDPNAVIGGRTALSIAAREGDAASARALLEAGAIVDRAAKDGTTPLMIAARHGNLDYARALLDAGADPRAASQDGNTPLHAAAAADSAALVDLLIARGADIGARTATDLTALDGALLFGAARSAGTLARHGATITLGNSASEKMLACAVRNDVVEAVEAALREGWPADSTFAGVWPAVRLASIFKSRRSLEALLAAGARPVDESLPTPLATVSELDQPIAVARQGIMEDPRDTDEVFAETKVRVSVLIDSEGRPLFPQAIDAADPRVGMAAAESTLSWRFKNPTRNGLPVAVRVGLPIVFPASTKRVFALERVSQRPKPTKQVSPEFPYHLKKAGVTGRAEIGFVVDTEGKPVDIEVLSATDPAFGAAAVEAIRQWEFTPGSVDGRPVHTRMKQPMSFTLNE